VTSGPVGDCFKSFKRCVEDLRPSSNATATISADKEYAGIQWEQHGMLVKPITVPVVPAGSATWSCPTVGAAVWQDIMAMQPLWNTTPCMMLAHKGQRPAVHPERHALHALCNICMPAYWGPHASASASAAAATGPGDTLQLLSRIRSNSCQCRQGPTLAGPLPHGWVLLGGHALLAHSWDAPCLQRTSPACCHNTQDTCAAHVGAARYQQMPDTDGTPVRSLLLTCAPTRCSRGKAGALG
jgi:hypothetical protein